MHVQMPAQSGHVNLIGRIFSVARTPLLFTNMKIPRRHLLSSLLGNPPPLTRVDCSSRLTIIMLGLCRLLEDVADRVEETTSGTHYTHQQIDSVSLGSFHQMHKANPSAWVLPSKPDHRTLMILHSEATSRCQSTTMVPMVITLIMEVRYPCLGL